MNLSPQFLEAVNGVLLVVFVGILFVFGRYILEAMRCYGWCAGRRHRHAAISVFVLVLGDTIIRACIWLLRHHENNEGWSPTSYTTFATIGTTVGVVVCIAGGICILRHFAPREWGQWPSIVVVTVALAFGIGMAM